MRRYARQYEMTGQSGSAGVSANIVWVMGHFDYLDQIVYSVATAAAIVVARGRMSAHANFSLTVRRD